jgi:hypothetical protein
MEEPVNPKPPTVREPTVDEIEDMISGGIAEATDGCVVEPDGLCEHGFPSWLLYRGYL